MGCTASAQARTAQTSPQSVQVAAAQTATNQTGGSSSSPQPNVDHPKSAPIESATTTEHVQEANDQIDAPSAGN